MCRGRYEVAVHEGLARTRLEVPLEVERSSLRFEPDLHENPPRASVTRRWHESFVVIAKARPGISGHTDVRPLLAVAEEDVNAIHTLVCAEKGKDRKTCYVMACRLKPRQKHRDRNGAKVGRPSFAPFCLYRSVSVGATEGPSGPSFASPCEARMLFDHTEWLAIRSPNRNTETGMGAKDGPP
jgi:hypothetical protein